MVSRVVFVSKTQLSPTENSKRERLVCVCVLQNHIYSKFVRSPAKVLSPHLPHIRYSLSLSIHRLQNGSVENVHSSAKRWNMKKFLNIRTEGDGERTLLEKLRTFTAQFFSSL